MITIDPNLRGCGVALWAPTGRLVLAEYVKNAHEFGRGYRVIADLAEAVHESRCFKYGDRSAPVVIEHPRFYGSTHQKGDPNDTLDCGMVGAAIAAKRWGSVEHVFPSDWKGNVKKQIMLERIWLKLSDAEKAVVQKTNKSDTEDILDSVGIGLWKLNRLTTRKFANE